MGANHPRRAEMQAFSVKLRKLGIAEQIGFGPTLTGFRELIERHGLNEKLNKKRIALV